MTCSNCQTELPDGSRFCKECGKKLELVCPACGKPLPADSKFCLQCGCDLRALSESHPVDYSAPQSYTPKFLAEKILTTRSAM